MSSWQDWYDFLLPEDDDCIDNEDCECKACIRIARLEEQGFYEDEE